MSTGCECAFIERKPGEWFYLLEDYHAPKNSFDWREYATAYGPFKNRAEADQHLHDNHANPGGSWTREYDKDHQEDAVETRLFEAAIQSKAKRWRW